jgi:NCS2 family nucleobase:cation symporter-2
VAIRPPDLVYALEEQPPMSRLAALGVQYAILIAVYLVIVVIVARNAGATPEVTGCLVSLALIAAASGTVFQAYNGRGFGSGYLAPPVYSAIYLGPAILAAKAGGLPAVAGMTIFAGLVEIVLSRFLTQLRVVFQPTISGFTVLVVGIQLGLVGMTHTLDVPDENSPELASHIAVAVVTVATCVGFSIWGRVPPCEYPSRSRRRRNRRCCNRLDWQDHARRNRPCRMAGPPRSPVPLV